MHLSKSDIENTPKIKRLNIINSVTGIKPANLVGTISQSGEPNLAIFSSLVHLGSKPPLLGFILRPTGDVRRHTYENILDTGYYTVNHVPKDLTKNAHLTSAKYAKNESEFEKCGFTEEYLSNFKAPFVKESNLKIGLQYLESVPIKANNTVLVIGEIQDLYFESSIMDEEGHLDLEKSGAVGISGLNSYYSLSKIGHYPYARAEKDPGSK